MPVVDVQTAPPRHLTRVNAQRVALLDVVVHHRGKQVVRGGDGVQIAREVQVNLLHRQHLRPAATCRAALHAEHRAERRFAQRQHRPFADFRHAVRQADGNGRFALARGGRVDGGDENELGAHLAAHA